MTLEQDQGIVISNKVAAAIFAFLTGLGGFTVGNRLEAGSGRQLEQVEQSINRRFDIIDSRTLAIFQNQADLLNRVQALETTAAKLAADHNRFAGRMK